MTFRVCGVATLSLLFAAFLMPLTKRYDATPASRSAQSSLSRSTGNYPDRNLRIDVEAVPFEQDSIDRRGEIELSGMRLDVIQRLFGSGSKKRCTGP
ncbi:hypothetical protein Q2941_40690 [Bradyrhizobium sp. UFLA05-153]